MTQLDLDFARAQADRGMHQALDHAERESPSWGEVAFAFLRKFARDHSTFISEDVSDASKAWGMVQPPSDRAWGYVYKRALKEGIITRCGAGVSRRRHGSICPLWQSRSATKAP